MSTQVLKNAHTARRLFPVEPDPVCPNKGDIVEYGIKKVIKKVGDGEEDFVVEDKVVEVSRINRLAFIAQDALDVGVMNILEKVRRSGDLTLWNQTGFVVTPSDEVDSLGRPYGEVQDFVNAPGSIGEALRAVKTGSNSFAGLKAIFGNISFDDLASMSESDIASKLQAFVDSQKGTKEDDL